VIRLRDLLRVFAVIGMTSFGGAVSGWMYREIVERRRWMPPQDFLTGAALARAMPGLNVVNLSIWIGYQLRRGPGAFAANLGMLALPAVLIIVCAMLYQRFGQSALVHQVLSGITAAAIAFTLSMGLRSLRAAAPAPFYVLIIALIFIMVGVLHWPMLPVVGILAPASVAWTALWERAGEGERAGEE
jgi:chromate transporter